MRTLAKTILVGASLSFAAVPAMAGDGNPADGSPVFGSAQVKVLSKTDNKKVVGKGYYADLFGSYGDYYSQVALQNSYYGNIYSSTSNESFYYAAARENAYSAYVWYAWAAYYAGQ